MKTTHLADVSLTINVCIAFQDSYKGACEEVSTEKAQPLQLVGATLHQFDIRTHKNCPQEYEMPFALPTFTMLSLFSKSITFRMSLGCIDLPEHEHAMINVNACHTY